jgi:hypothetical protein
MNPPQTDKLSILRAVLAQLAGRGGTPSPEGFDTPMRPVTRYPSPSGFDATMRGMKPEVPLRERVPAGYTVEETPGSYTSGDSDQIYGLTATGNMPDGRFHYDNQGVRRTDSDLFPKLNNPQSQASRVQNPDVTGFDAALRGQGVVDRTPKSKSSKNGTKTITSKMEAEKVTAPVRQTNPDVTGFDAALRGEGVSDRARPAQASGKATPKPSAQASAKPAPSGSSPTQQQEKASSPSKSAPVAQAEPSGEALTYFRKNKSSAGWDALGTAVSLVQQSLKPEKGGLKSRAEYDRLLRGSDNFKKLDGNEQQRVRQAFAQWMNEQTIFKGKA